MSLCVDDTKSHKSCKTLRATRSQVITSCTWYSSGWSYRRCM